MAISSDIMRGHLEGIILKLIIEKDRYGYEIASTIKARTKGQFEIKEATLYALVQRLEQKGFIRSYIGDKSFGRKRRYYTITEEGKMYFALKKAEWLELKTIINALWEENHDQVA